MGIVSKRIHGWHMLLGLVELASSAVLFGSMVVIWEARFSLVEGVYLRYLALVIAAILADNFRQLREPGLLATATLSGEILLVLRRTVVAALVWLAFLAALQDHSVSRLFLFTYLLLLPPCLLLARRFAGILLAPKVFGSEYRFGVILLGNPEKSDELVNWLASKQGVGMHLVGYLAPEAISTDIPLPWIGTEQDLVTAVERTQARLVVSLVLPSDDDQARWLRDSCDRLGTRLAFQCRLGGESSSRISLCQDDGVTLLSLRNEPLQSPFNRLTKRTFDLCLAIPLVILVLPPMAGMVWLLHRFTSPGPLFFKQRRGGLGGNPFTLYKFRTMHCGNPDESRQTTSGDDRIFKGGAWLRKFSIDEFPQFYNVLEGSMSIVGPRPHLEVHDAAFSQISAEYRIRTLVKPGITGLAQVQGHRGPTPEDHHITARVKADLRYLENWTLSTDVILVLRTVIHLLRPTNAV